MSDLKVRATSGVVALAVLIPALSFGGYWVVFGFAALAAAWGLHEIVTMGLPQDRKWAFPLIVVLGAGYFLLAADSGGAAGFYPFLYLGDLGLDATLVVVCSSTLLSSVFFVLTAKSTEGLADRWAHFALGPAYVALPLGLLAALSALPAGTAWLWVPMVVAFASDTGGYFAGRAFGKHKLLPLISPKKTWEGLVGGVALAVVGMCVFKAAVFDVHFADVASITIVDCIVLGVAGALAGVIGDLTASMIKRSHGVKDSGRFLPGHGGVLDRIDALLFVVPVVWLWLEVVRPALET